MKTILAFTVILWTHNNAAWCETAPKKLVKVGNVYDRAKIQTTVAAYVPSPTSASQSTSYAAQPAPNPPAQAPLPPIVLNRHAANELSDGIGPHDGVSDKRLPKVETAAFRLSKEAGLFGASEVKPQK